MHNCLIESNFRLNFIIIYIFLIIIILRVKKAKLLSELTF